MGGLGWDVPLFENDSFLTCLRIVGFAAPPAQRPPVTNDLRRGRRCFYRELGLHAGSVANRVRETKDLFLMLSTYALQRLPASTLY